MIVVPGPSSIMLGKRIAMELTVDPNPVDHRIFPDGESYIRLTSPVEGEIAVIVQTTSPPQDTHMMQLLMMTCTASELGAEKVICVVPSLAYSRQDKRFLEGEALSLNIVIGLLEEAGAHRLIVVDVHNSGSLQRIQRRHEIEFITLSAIRPLADYLGKLGYSGAYSLSPDKGAINLAKQGGEVLGGGVGFFEKSRNRKTGEIEMTVKDLDIEGEDAVVFDDIISSGGTTARAVAGLKAQGARRIVAACTHGLFMGEAEKRIREAGADLIVSTDTIASKFSQVSVAPLVAEHLREMNV